MKTLVGESLYSLAENPAFWPLAFFIPLVFLVAPAVYSKRVSGWMHRQSTLLMLLGLLMTEGYVYGLCAGGFSPMFLGRISANIAEVSWYFWEGKPVYHGL